MGKNDVADRFKGFDWKTEEDAFMDGYHQHEKGGEFVTYARLRAMGTNGFQEPAVGIEGGPVAAGSSPGGTTTGQQPGMVVQGPAIEGARGKEPVQQATPTSASAPPAPPPGSERIIGTKRLYADGKFNTKDGKAVFMETKWRGLQAPGKEEEFEEVPVPRQQRPHEPRLAVGVSRPAERLRDGPLSVPVHRDEPAGHGGAQHQGGRPRRGVQRQRLDAGDGLPDRAGEAEADLHAVRLPDGRAGQRRLARRERVHHPELQADLGQRPQARGCARGREGAVVQVEGVFRLCSFLPTSPGGSGRPDLSIREAA